MRRNNEYVCGVKKEAISEVNNSDNSQTTTQQQKTNDQSP